MKAGRREVSIVREAAQAAVLLLCAWVGSASAQSPAAPSGISPVYAAGTTLAGAGATLESPAPLTLNSGWGKRRILGEHRFPVAVFVPSVLSSSYLGVRAGLEYHQVPGYAQLPTLGSASTPQPVDLRTINVAETIDFALRLHDYVAIFGDAYGRARLGANTATLLGTGADYTYGGDLGVLLKLLRIHSFQLGVRAQLGYYAGQSAGILALFEDLNAIASDAISRVQQAPNLDLQRALNQLNAAFRNATADLLTPFSGVTYSFSLNAAQGIGQFVGLQGSLGVAVDTATYQPTMFDPALGVPRMSEYQVRSVRPHFALAIDLDLAPVRVPIDFMFEYRISPVRLSRSNAPQAGGDTSLEQLVALGIYYSGRSDLQLGITGYVLFGQPPALGANAQPSGEPLDLGTQFVFRYFW